MYKKQFVYLILMFAFASAFVLGNAVFISAETVNVWDGTAANSFSSGSGTSDDPYLISTARELEFFAKSVNGGNNYSGEYVKLACDIVLNDESFAFDPDSGLIKVSDTVNTAWIGTGVCGDESGRSDVFDNSPSQRGVFYKSSMTGERGAYEGTLYEHIPIGKEFSQFSGVFDGDGHTVSGIYVSEDRKNGVGLFGYVCEAQISGVSVNNSCIYGNSRVGAIGGSVDFSRVSLSCADACVLAASDVGGVFGYISDTIVSQSYNAGTVIGSSKVGGIVGVCVGSVRDAYNSGIVYAEAYAGGIAGQNLGDINNCYNASKINASENVGAIAGYTSTAPNNSFYISGSVGESDGGMTEAQMCDSKSFSGFDFVSVWTLGTADGYPYPILSLLSHSEHVHTFTDECDSKCNGCSFEREVTHSFGNRFYNDESAHYLVCELCGELGSVDAHEYDGVCDSICNVCSYDRDVSHDFSGAWYSDDKCHWHECSKCGEKTDETAHSPGKEATEDSAQTCKICAFVITPALSHKHSYTGKWISSDEGHYRECDCGAHSEIFEHRWDSGTLTKFPDEDTPGVMTYKCDICARKKTQYVEDIKDIIDPDNGEDSDSILPDGEADDGSVIRENNVYPESGGKKDISLAISIGALVVGFLNLAMIAVIIVILLKKNQNGRNV
ncbi:MAG: hypothetical protein E7626_03730 [Ruminococcaceae bacterium]|nr:hypothetical protein [Oscillospiraceae bacterium]